MMVVVYFGFAISLYFIAVAVIRTIAPGKPAPSGQNHPQPFTVIPEEKIIRVQPQPPPRTPLVLIDHIWMLLRPERAGAEAINVSLVYR